MPYAVIVEWDRGGDDIRNDEKVTRRMNVEDDPPAGPVAHSADRPPPASTTRTRPRPTGPRRSRRSGAIGIGGTRVMSGLAGIVVAAALGVGSAAGQAGPTAATQPADIDPSCVLGITSVDVPPGAEPWELGLIARSDALDRQYRVGRYAPGGECADVPDRFGALMIRSDAMNRRNGLGPYAPDAR
jgi:hypothetical protein